MDRPVTDLDLGAPAGEEGAWLVDAESPALSDAVMPLIADDSRPHRLAWNTFRTLALWDTDAWVPRALEIAIGQGNRLSALEWGGGSVVPWPVPIDAPQLSDFVLDGPEAYVVMACTVVPEPPETELRAAAMAALDGSLHGAREAGLVVVAPPGSDDMRSRLQMATDVELHGGRLAFDLLDGAMGWISWPELGRIALDLAEEGDPDVSPVEQVRRLVSELQARFPGATL